MKKQNLTCALAVATAVTAMAAKPVAPVKILDAAPPADGLLPVKLVDPVEGKGGYNVFLKRGQQGWQVSTPRKTTTPPVREFKWSKRDRRMLETQVPGRPTLHGEPESIQISIPVNTAKAPGFQAMAIRVIDANGETFQYGAKLNPKHSGWQEAQFSLAPKMAEQKYGGKAEGKGVMDLPAVLSTLIFMPPEKFETPYILEVGAISRNAFDESAIASTTKMKSVNVSLHTANPVYVVEQGAEEKACVRASVDEGGFAVDCKLKLKLTDYEGQSHDWISDTLKMAPGKTVEIPLNQIALPQTGWWKVESYLVSTKDGKEIQKNTFQLAYINPVGRRADGLKADDFVFALDSRVRHPAMYNLLASIGVDMLRYGTWGGTNRREGQWQWAQFDREVNEMRAAGLTFMPSITFTPDWAAQQKYVDLKKQGKLIHTRSIKLTNTPPREEALRKSVKEFVSHNAKLGATVYDLWNEPDLSGFWQGTTDEYLDYMRICYEEVKATQPDAKMITGGIATLGNHGGHNLNPDMIQRMIVDNYDYYDAISVHQHGHFNNFQTGLDGVLAPIRKQLKNDKPLWFTETGYNGKIEEVAQELVQKFSLARARGAQGLIWYAMYAPGKGGGYSMVNREGPNPVLPAYNEMVRLMRGKQFQKQYDVGFGNWMFNFYDSVKDETLLVAWNENAVADCRDQLLRVEAGAQVRLMNVMGQPFKVDRFEDFITFQIQKDVRYLVVKGTVKLVDAPLEITERIKGVAGEKLPFVVHVSNPLSTEADINLKWNLEGVFSGAQTITVPARGKTPVTIMVQIPQLSTADVAPQLEIAYAVANTSIKGIVKVDVDAVRRIPATQMSGRAPDFVADDHLHIQNNNKADPTRAHLAWGGAEDLSVKVWLQHDGANLLMRADVSDDKHVQAQEANMSWKSDGIQMGVALPGKPDAWEIGLARHNSGESLVSVWRSPVGLSREIQSKIQLKTTPRDGGMVYEAQIPLAALGTTAAELVDKGVSFNLIVNDDDGAGRKGFAFVAKGLGIHPDSAKWPKILFSPVQ